MSQNTIFKDGTNPVIIEFNIDGGDLTSFTEITAKFGADQRSSVADPSSVIVNSPTELELNFQDTTETLSNYWCIKGDGTILSSECMANLSKSPICEEC